MTASGGGEGYTARVDPLEAIALALRDGAAQIATSLDHLSATLEKAVAAVQDQPVLVAIVQPTPGPPVRAIFSIQGGSSAMGTTFDVDATNEAAVIGEVDDKLDPTTLAPGLSASLAFTDDSGNPSTLLSAGEFAVVPGTDSPFGDTLQAPLIVSATPDISGPTDVVITATLSPEPADGQPDPVTVTVDPGAPAGAQLSVQP
jgi:hypothetical protein